VHLKLQQTYQTPGAEYKKTSVNFFYLVLFLLDMES